MFRRTYANVNLDNIKSNMRETIKFAKKEYAYAVVKANAYGHGAIDVSKACLDAGATHLAVSSLDEALQLRKEFSKVPILVLGYTEERDFAIASKYAITLTITNMSQIEKLSKFSEPLKVHFKVNTGMNRLGFNSSEDVREAYVALRYNSNVVTEGIFTHFATADMMDIAYYLKQFRKFERIVDDIGKYFKIIHCQNSAATLHPLEGMEKCNAFRLGISLYGYRPSLEKEPKIELKPAIEVYSHVSNINRLKKGSKVGYGASYVLEQDGIIATIPIGYADGIIRANTSRSVVINGNRYPIVGRVCMDQLMILVDETVKMNDRVELIGPNITVEELSKHLNTIDHEVLCLISSRVPRIYYEDGEQVSIKCLKYNI